VHDASPGPDIACADLTTFCRLDELGLEVTDARDALLVLTELLGLADVQRTVE